jgi:hypothetical protein
MSNKLSGTLEQNNRHYDYDERRETDEKENSYMEQRHWWTLLPDLSYLMIDSSRLYKT